MTLQKLGNWFGIILVLVGVGIVFTAGLSPALAMNENMYRVFNPIWFVFFGFAISVIGGLVYVIANIEKFFD